MVERNSSRNPRVYNLWDASLDALLCMWASCLRIALAPGGPTTHAQLALLLSGLRIAVTVKGLAQKTCEVGQFPPWKRVFGSDIT